MENLTFLQALDDFLQARIINPVPLTKEAPKLAKYEKEVDKFEEELRNCLPSKDYKTLLNLSNANTSLLTEAIEYAYRKGFKEGVQFVIHIQSME